MSELLRTDLYSRILIDPALSGCNGLRILTGYASAAFTIRHLLDLKEELKLDVGVQLNIGMTGESGVSLSEHRAFRAAVSEISGGWLSVRYAPEGVSDHTKAYVWSRDGVPVEAWLGSGNYSRSGFGLDGSRRETMTEVDPYEAESMIQSASDGFVSAVDPQVLERVHVFEVERPEQRSRVIQDDGAALLGPSERSATLRAVCLPLVQTTRSPGEVHNAGAGLNWGQRGNRNRAEAYIPVPASVAKIGFFPPRKDHFVVHTSGGDVLFLVVAQQGDKALESKPDNAALGRWFRRRLGLAEDAFVHTQDLVRFGSKHVTFTQLDDGTYFMGFMPDVENA